jgi:hypothetical protein
MPRPRLALSLRRNRWFRSNRRSLPACELLHCLQLCFGLAELVLSCGNESTSRSAGCFTLQRQQFAEYGNGGSRKWRSYGSKVASAGCPGLFTDAKCELYGTSGTQPLRSRLIRPFPNGHVKRSSGPGSAVKNGHAGCCDPRLRRSGWVGVMNVKKNLGTARDGPGFGA